VWQVNSVSVISALLTMHAAYEFFAYPGRKTRRNEILQIEKARTG
jgi:hypothetical protein